MASLVNLVKSDLNDNLHNQYTDFLVQVQTWAQATDPMHRYGSDITDLEKTRQLTMILVN